MKRNLKVQAGIAAGFTVLELLIVAAVISILLALLLPATARVREASRRLSCRNNQRQLAIGILGQLDTHGQFPSIYQNEMENWALHSEATWISSSLPWIDQSNLYDQMSEYDSLHYYVSDQGDRPHLSVLTCPSDVSVVGQDDLSFGFNAGLTQLVSTPRLPRKSSFNSIRQRQPLDLNGDGVTKYTSVDASFRESVRIQLATSLGRSSGSAGIDSRRANYYHHRPATVDDGMSNTIMLAENIRNGYDPTAPSSSGWILGNTHNLSVGIPDYVCEQRKCTEANVDLARTNRGPGHINSGVSALAHDWWTPKS